MSPDKTRRRDEQHFNRISDYRARSNPHACTGSAHQLCCIDLARSREERGGCKMSNLPIMWQICVVGCLLAVIIVPAEVLWRIKTGSKKPLFVYQVIDAIRATDQSVKGRVAQHAFFGSVIKSEQPHMRPPHATAWRIVRRGDTRYDTH